MDLQPDFTNATWVQDFAQDFCAAHPKSPLCHNVDSFYEYRINLAANIVFLALFSISFVAYAATWIVRRTGTAFNVALLLGLTCEVIGYVGRILSHANPWGQDGFLMQICCLTIGPAFMAAGIYLCLRRIVSTFGSENSRIPPEYYTRIFIPCDVISLVLQAVGGAMASIASSNHESVTTGSNIMIAGLSFQVITLVAFVTASADFAIRTYRRYRAIGNAALDQNPVLVQMRSSWLFKGFLGTLSVATICILWRSAFRVAELSGGWTGPIMGRQDLFIGFEGALIVIAVAALNIFHPAFCVRPLLEGGGGLKGLWFLRGNKKKGSTQSVSVSDEESKTPTSV